MSNAAVTVDDHPDQMTTPGAGHEQSFEIQAGGEHDRLDDAGQPFPQRLRVRLQLRAASGAAAGALALTTWRGTRPAGRSGASGRTTTSLRHALPHLRLVDLSGWSIRTARPLLATRYSAAAGSVTRRNAGRAHSTDRHAPRLPARRLPRLACTWQYGRVSHPDSPSVSPHTPVRSRRDFLRGVLASAATGVFGVSAAAGLAGCNPFAEPQDEPPPADELAGFLGATVALGDRYDTTIAAVPALAEILTPMRDAHRAHADALASALGVPVPSGGDADPAPSGRSAALAALAEAEKSARTEAVAACLAASVRLAPLLGSIAAARASHVEVLT